MPPEAVAHDLMYGRKRVKLVSSAFGKEKFKIIDLLDVYSHVRAKMEMLDEREFSSLQTPTLRKNKRQKRSGQYH